MHHNRVTIGILVFSVFLGLFLSNRSCRRRTVSPYTRPVDPNVTFWTKHFMPRYSTAQAVVHDSVHLDIGL